MKWMKAIIVGLIASSIMTIITMLGVNVLGFAPFNLPPAQAFLDKIGFNAQPLPLILHFGYGALWSIVLVFITQIKPNARKGVLLSFGLWLIFMLIYSPIIGWGVFGFGEARQLPEKDPLHLTNAWKFIGITLVLHIIYGVVVGWLNNLWLSNSQDQEEEDQA